jgi:DNA-binding IclR family transcriptional regulator
LAAQVAKKQTGFSALINKGNEALFRSQEHTYRALALFRRAGGQLPASSGVCGSLALAQSDLRHATEPLDPSASPAHLREEAQRLRESADDWTTVVESMIAEYHCP